MMQNQPRFVALVLGLLIAFTGRAHDPDLSSLVIQKVEGVWVMKIDFVPSSIEKCWIENGISAASLQSTPEAEYKQRLSNHFKSRIQLITNGDTLTLGSGGLRFHSHNAQLIYTIPGYHPYWDTFELQFDFCEAQSGHQSILRVQHTGEEQYKQILNQSNNTVVFLRSK